MDDDDDRSVMSTDLPPADMSPKRKKRSCGRLPTTEYYVGLKQAKLAAAEAMERAALAEAELAVTDDSIPPPPLNTTARRIEEEAWEKSSTAPQLKRS